MSSAPTRRLSGDSGTHLLFENLQPLVQRVIHLDPPVHHTPDNTSRRFVGNLGLEVELAITARDLLVPLERGISGVVDKVSSSLLVVDGNFWRHQHEQDLVGERDVSVSDQELQAGRAYLEDQIFQDLGVLVLVILQVLGLLGRLLKDAL